MIRSLPDAEGVLQLERLSELAGIRHGFASRRGRLEEATGGPVARLRQVHGAVALALPREPAERASFLHDEKDLRPPADALISDQPGVTVAVAVADCLPILLAAPAAGVVAAVHAGWRGLAAGVVESATATMIENFGATAADIVVGIGPAIGPCCFEVGAEVLEAFNDRGYGDEAHVPVASGSRPHCDLSAVAVAVVLRLGVQRDNIANAGVCTQCNSDWLWSYRQYGDNAGRMICGISLVER